MHSLSTHQSLLARLSRGDDQAAWSECFARYRDLILAVARRRGFAGADGDDVLQDVFVELGKALPRFQYDRERGRFRGFLKTITVRMIGRRLRQRGPDPAAGTTQATPEADEGPGAPDPEFEATWEAEWRQYHLRQAMATLRNEVRASDMRVFEDVTQGRREPGQIAAELGLTVNAIHQTKSRMLKRLRELIAAQVLDEG
ncbi:MAG: sigma-70 family RNA polymerase sigma factor [Planctomycetes bacterium]|nr:sigma-70 family RNA polymerase sigma factor [Planctomycetota bacterium]